MEEAQSGPLVTKLFTVLEYPGEEVAVEVRRQHFEKFTQEEITTIVSRLMVQAAGEVEKASEAFAAEDAHFKTPRNNGSLYDDIVFECGVYATETDEIFVNPSFGRQADPANALRVSLEHVQQVLLLMAQRFQENPPPLYPEEVTPEGDPLPF